MRAIKFFALLRWLIKPLMNNRGAFESGKGASFKIDDAAAALTDIGPYITSVDFPQEVAVLETTVLGDNDRTYIVGLKGSTISLAGHWDGGADPAVDVTLSGILGQAATVSIEYGPQGAVSGDIKYTAEAILTRYTITANVDGVVDWTADIQITGAVTRGTFA